MPSETENLKLYKPDAGETGVADELNSNWSILDDRFDDARGHLHDGKPGNAPKIPVTSIGASGVPSATTYLRGDGSWQAVEGGGDGETTWDEITGKPATYPSDWDTTIDKPATFPSDYNTQANKPAAYPTTWDTVTGKPATFPTTPAQISGLVDGAYWPHYIVIWSGITQTTASYVWHLSALDAITDPISAVDLLLYGECHTGGAFIQISNAVYTFARVQIMASGLAGTASVARGVNMLRADRNLDIIVNGSWSSCYLAICAYVKGPPVP
jgi:hypothetical protein